MESKKKTVVIELFDNKKQVLTYEGRCLGLMTPAEYAALIEQPKLRSKLWTGETVPIGAISEINDVSDLRLVMTLKKRGSVEVFKKVLFISEPLDIVCHVAKDKTDISFNTKSFYGTLTEREAVAGNE